MLRGEHRYTLGIALDPSALDAPRTVCEVQALSSPPSTVGSRRGRPGLLLAVWALLLGLFATLAPMAQDLFGIPPELLSLVMLAPAVASLVVVVRPSWSPSPWPRVAWGPALTATGLAALAVVSFVVVLALLSGRSPSWPPTGIGAPVALYLVLQAVGALGEEVGWRGVVQRSGEHFARPAVVSAIAGFLFGATHLGYWSLGLVPVLTFSVTAMLMSLTITTLFVGSLWQRMLPAVVVHLGVNLGLSALAANDEPLATAPISLGAAAVMLAVAVAGAAARKKWSRSGASQ